MEALDTDKARIELCRRKEAQKVRESVAAKTQAVRALPRKDRWLAIFNDKDCLVKDEGKEDVESGCYLFPVPQEVPTCWDPPAAWTLQYGFDLIPKKFVSALEVKDKEGNPITLDPKEQRE